MKNTKKHMEKLGKTTEKQMEKDSNHDEAPKPKRIKKKVVTEINRSPMKVLDCETNVPIIINFQNKEKKKTEETYKKVKHRRQDQRTKHIYTLQREAWKMKVLTDDDVLVVIKSKERAEDKLKETNGKLKANIRPVQGYSTSRDVWFDISESAAHVHSITNTPSSENEDDVGDEFFLDAQNSPTKARRVKPTAPSSKKLTDLLLL